MATIDDDPKELRIDGVAQPQAPTGPEAADAAGQAGAVTALGETSPASGTNAVAEIAHAVAAGEIDAETAKARLIEDAVQAQLPAAADPALVEEIRAEVEALLAADPTLDALLRG